MLQGEGSGCSWEERVDGKTGLGRGRKRSREGSRKPIRTQHNSWSGTRGAKNVVT